jgi:GH25 family lysozyme M1 (1,4-beta-N-acetylmuramidase)
MQCSPNNRISAALTANVRRLGLVGGTALLSTMLCLGGGLPAQAVSPSPTDPASPEVSSPPSETAQPAAEPTPARIDMTALRAEIGKDGAYLGQGVKRRAATFAKQSTASSLNAISTEAANTWMAPGVQGLDVSSHQTSVNWAAQYSMGARFAYVKATEGTTYKNPYFGSQYGGALASGMIRGAYHFALPGVSTAAAQADYFVNNGGGWSGDGKTMPPLLDIEYNPYSSLGNTCYNLSQAAMVNWIAAFSNRVLARTGRLPMIYTTTDWWTQCTGNSGAFSRQPLHLASYSRYVGSMPNGWGTYSVWQYSATGPFAAIPMPGMETSPASGSSPRRRTAPCPPPPSRHWAMWWQPTPPVSSGIIRRLATGHSAPGSRSASDGAGCGPSTPLTGTPTAS